MSTHNKIYTFCDTNTHNSTSTRNTNWQYTLTAYHKYLSNSEGKQYETIESPTIITPQTILLQVTQKLLNKPPVKTNRKAPGYWHLKTPKNLIPTATADTDFLQKISVQNNNVSRMKNFIWINFNITLIMFYY